MIKEAVDTAWSNELCIIAPKTLLFSGLYDFFVDFRFNLCCCSAKQDDGTPQESDHAAL